MWEWILHKCVSVTVVVCVAAVILRGGASVLHGIAMLNLMFTVFAPQFNEVVHVGVWWAWGVLQAWFPKEEPKAPKRKPQRRRIKQGTAPPPSDRAQSRP
jgi:hypothetical protein